MHKLIKIKLLFYYIASSNHDSLNQNNCEYVFLNTHDLYFFSVHPLIHYACKYPRLDYYDLLLTNETRTNVRVHIVQQPKKIIFKLLF